MEKEEGLLVSHWPRKLEVQITKVRHWNVSTSKLTEAFRSRECTTPTGVSSPTQQLARKVPPIIGVTFSVALSTARGLAAAASNAARGPIRARIAATAAYCQPNATNATQCHS